jgi:hypothetical protein
MAWLKYIRDGRTDLVQPNRAVEAFRIAAANAGFRPDQLTSEAKLGMYVYNGYQGLALQCLNRLRLGIGETEKDIAAMRSHLAKAKLEPGDPGMELDDIGTDETEIAFFRTSDPLKAE